VRQVLLESLTPTSEPNHGVGDLAPIHRNPMPTTTLLPQSVTTTAYSGGADWTNQSNVLTDDGNSTTCTLAIGQSTYWLNVWFGTAALLTTFAGAAITGIMAEYEARGGATPNNLRVAGAQMIQRGTPTDCDKGADAFGNPNPYMTSTLTVYQIGTKADRWNARWNASDFAATDTGFRIRFVAGAATDSARVDIVKLHVTTADAGYTPADVDESFGSGLGTATVISNTWDTTGGRLTCTASSAEDIALVTFNRDTPETIFDPRMASSFQIDDIAFAVGGGGNIGFALFMGGTTSEQFTSCTFRPQGVRLRFWDGTAYTTTTNILFPVIEGMSLKGHCLAGRVYLFTGPSDVGPWSYVGVYELEPQAKFCLGKHGVRHSHEPAGGSVGRFRAWTTSARTDRRDALTHAFFTVEQPVAPGNESCLDPDDDLVNATGVIPKVHPFFGNMADARYIPPGGAARPDTTEGWADRTIDWLEYYHTLPCFSGKMDYWALFPHGLGEGGGGTQVSLLQHPDDADLNVDPSIEDDNQFHENGISATYAQVLDYATRLKNKLFANARPDPTWIAVDFEKYDNFFAATNPDPSFAWWVGMENDGRFNTLDVFNDKTWEEHITEATKPDGTSFTFDTALLITHPTNLDFRRWLGWAVQSNFEYSVRNSIYKAFKEVFPNAQIFNYKRWHIDHTAERPWFDSSPDFPAVYTVECLMDGLSPEPYPFREFWSTDLDAWELQLGNVSFPIDDPTDTQRVRGIAVEIGKRMFLSCSLDPQKRMVYPWIASTDNWSNTEGGEVVTIGGVAVDQRFSASDTLEIMKAGIKNTRLYQLWSAPGPGTSGASGLSDQSKSDWLSAISVINGLMPGDRADGFSLGINIGTAASNQSNNDPSQISANLFRIADPFVTRQNDYSTIVAWDPAQLDDAGYPKYLSAPQDHVYCVLLRAGTKKMVENHSTAAMRLVVKWDGTTGSVSVQGATVLETGTRRLLIEVDDTAPSVELFWGSLPASPGDDTHITNIRVCFEEDEANVDAGKLVSKEALRKLAPFKFIRWMQPATVNDEPVGITGNTAANPTVITTNVAHGIGTGDRIVIADSNSTPSIDGEYTSDQYTVINSTSFSLTGVNVTVAGTEGGVWTPWNADIDERPSIDSAQWNDREKGMPLKAMARMQAEIADTNETGTAKAGWFCIPFNADDSFLNPEGGHVHLAITEIEGELPVGSTYIAEQGNELWNGLFGSFQEAKYRGLVLHGGDENYAAGRYIAQRNIEFAIAARGAQGVIPGTEIASHHQVLVCGTFILADGNPISLYQRTHEHMGYTVETPGLFDYVAVAPYVCTDWVSNEGGSFGATWKADYLANGLASALDLAFARMYSTEIPGLITAIQAAKADWTLPMICYEWGIHFYFRPGTEYDADFLALTDAFLNDLAHYGGGQGTHGGNSGRT
jgi:hypothetical protein